jgi:hypothetical protein
MTLAWLALLAVALGLAWWVVRRAVRYRREAERREALVLEALFLARHTADGGASIDVDQIFGVAPPSAAPTSADAVLRAVELQADAVALLNRPLAERPAAGLATTEMPAGPGGGHGDRAAVLPEARADGEPAGAAEVTPASPAPVRDLVQVFYEARGFRPAPADPAARPVETVLAHPSDARRAYAFAPLEEPPSEAALQSIIECARGIGQKRVLIAVERGMASSPGGELPAHGVRVLDRRAIDAELARLDAGVADRIRATARRRARQRPKSG